MSITIQIPTPLQRFTGDHGDVEVEGATVGQALESLVSRFAELRPHLYTDDGTLRSFVNVFKNDEDVRYLQKNDTPLTDGDHLTIIPSIAGGNPTIAGGNPTIAGGNPTIAGGNPTIAGGNPTIAGG